MAMTASSRAPLGAGPKESERSPFARTTELLAPYKPAKPLIVLSLGEPQHPVPRFVGPVLAQHLADFGHYPLAKGIEPFRKAAAAWLSTRFKMPRAIDPRSEEHTSELQSRGHLACRLLLEKKKNNEAKPQHTYTHRNISQPPQPN